MSAEEIFKKLVEAKIVSEKQFARIEQWQNREVLVLRLVTDPQSYDVQEFAKCDLLHAESTGDTINANNYYFSNFR